jgi:hypothetical protein
MVLLGSKPKGRNTEQHDVFFGIAHSLIELYPDLIDFWPDAKGLHIDAWREVNVVEGYRIAVECRAPDSGAALSLGHSLFFINLGGYQEFKFEEQHYVVLSVQPDKASAIKKAKETLFFQNKTSSHVDDKYGIDVDDIYQIEDILVSSHKSKYKIMLTPSADLTEDVIQLGYIPFE